MINYKKWIATFLFIFCISSHSFCTDMQSAFTAAELANQIQAQDPPIQYGYLHKCAIGLGIVAKEQEYFAVIGKEDLMHNNLFTADPIDIDLEEARLFNLTISENKWQKFQTEYATTKQATLFLNFDKSSEKPVKYLLSPTYSLDNTVNINATYLLKYGPFGDLSSDLGLACDKNKETLTPTRSIGKEEYIAAVNAAGGRGGGVAYPLTPEGLSQAKKDFMVRYQYMFKNHNANYLNIYTNIEWAYIKVSHIGLTGGTWLSLEKQNFKQGKRNGYYIEYNFNAMPIP